MMLASRPAPRLAGRSSSRPQPRLRSALVVPKAQADVNGALKVIGAELDAVLEQLRKGSGPDAAASSPQVEVEGQVLFCDENGCVLLDRSTAQSKAASVSSLDTLLTGEGWVLGHRDSETDSASTGTFNCMVGGSGWDVSLTAAELSDFILALQSIRKTMRDLLSRPGAAPSAKNPTKVKFDTTTVRMEATNTGTNADSFQLTFWIGAGRACRATWAADVVADVLTTLDAHAVFQAPKK